MLRNRNKVKFFKFLWLLCGVVCRCLEECLLYCNLTRTFGGTSNGWKRVAELDVNNCPPGMRTETVSTSTTCKVSEGGAG